MKIRSSVGLIAMPVVAAAFVIGSQFTSKAQEVSEPVTSAVQTPVTEPEVSFEVEPIATDSPLGDLVELVKAGLDESILMAYVEATPRLFMLSANNIIYLSDLGAPASVIKAVMLHDQKLLREGGVSIALDESAEAAAPTEPVVLEEPVALVEETVVENTDATMRHEFDVVLSPYGSWVDVEGYGRCWRPSVARYDAGWRPYSNNGHWVYSDHGWYWKSNYSWGWATFHYGRWFFDAMYGWCWWPDSVWAPSWVYWRYNDNYCGWAPLPPRTAYRTGVGIVYRDKVVSVGFDFGLDVSRFTFVLNGDVCSLRPWERRIRPAEAARFFTTTRSVQHYGAAVHGRELVNHGMPWNQVPERVRRTMSPVKLNYSKNVRQGAYVDRRRGTLTIPAPQVRSMRSAQELNAPVTVNSGNAQKARARAEKAKLMQKKTTSQTTVTPVSTRPVVTPQQPQTRERTRTRTPARQPASSPQTTTTTPAPAEVKPAAVAPVTTKTKPAPVVKKATPAPQPSTKPAPKVQPQKKVVKPEVLDTTGK